MTPLNAALGNSMAVPVMRASAAGEDMPEEEAMETVRLVLKEWKRRGWL